MKTLFTILALGGLACTGFSQTVVSSSGESYSNGSGSIEFTIGEPVIETVSNGTVDITQGFHQTNWNFAGVDDFQPDFEAIVYPNPMQDQLMVKSPMFEGVLCRVYDATGRIVREVSLEGEITGINVQDFAPGAYQLTLLDANATQIKTFNLIKTH